jgi:hypothetical protein
MRSLKIGKNDDWGLKERENSLCTGLSLIHWRVVHIRALAPCLWFELLLKRHDDDSNMASFKTLAV